MFASENLSASNDGRKIKREEAEFTLEKINNKIKEIKQQIQPLHKLARRQQKIIETRIYEEKNDYIRLLDPHLNYITSVIIICLSYLPVDYCIEHMHFFPKVIGCVQCITNYRDTDLHFKPNDQFSLHMTGKYTNRTFDHRRWNIMIVDFHSEDDLISLNYLKSKVPLYETTNIKEKNRLVVYGYDIDQVGKHQFYFNCYSCMNNKYNSCNEHLYSVYLQLS